MEQAQERWLWVMKRREVNLDTRVNYTVYGGAWEEDQAGFAEDHHAERMNIHLWPPRCYSCSFCKREFKSAQALGGHMNVHRRDRARLKQTIHHHDKSSSDHNHVHDQHDSSSPNTDIAASKVSALWSSSPSSSLMGKRSSSSVCHDVHDHVHHVETSLSVGLNRDQGNEFCKRSKITTTTSSSSVSTRPPVARGGCLLMSSSSSSSNDKCGLIRASSNVNKETNLDLELRLGDAPKVK